MKKFLIFASFITCTPFTTFTMEHHEWQKVDIEFDEIWNTEDIQLQQKPIEHSAQTSPQPPKKDIPQDKLLEFTNLLDAAINKKYSAKNIWGSEYQIDSSALQEKDFFDIINIIEKFSDTYDFIKTDTIETFDFLKQKLYIKNKYFRRTLEHFYDLARDNINSVTSDTLETIMNLNAVQPTPQLNALPPYIKYYFMNYAYNNKINHSYDIILTTPEGNITCVDIHAATHRAVTGSHGKLCLWDLITGEPINIFHLIEDDNSADCVAFNSEGSHLATATNFKNGSSLIRILDIQSTQRLYQKEVKTSPIALLTYKNKTLIACSDNDSPKFSIFYIHNNEIQKGEDAINLQYTFPSYLAWGNYIADNPYFKRYQKSTLTITKQQCQQLYIYQRAIKNDPFNFTFEKINKTNFTELDKDMLRTLLITEQKTRK